MATEQSNITSNTIMSEKDIHKLDRALKSAEFRQLLVDYAREVSDEGNRAAFERDVTAMERERGFEVTFLHPAPGYVCKTVNLKTDEKVFVNVCADEHVDPPTSRSADASGNAPGAGARGVYWSVPYMQAEPRKDLDRGGKLCSVYDVVFHPEALSLAATGGARLKEMVTFTALEAVERQYNVKLDHKNVKYPKMAFKGSFQRTVIRRPIQKREEEEGDDPVAPSADPAPSPPGGAVEPEYVIKYGQSLDDLPEWRDHSRMGGRVADPCRPSHVVVEISLPELTSTKGMDLDVTDTQLSLSSGGDDATPRYRLRVPFTYRVAEDEATAKFDVSTRRLTVSVPVVRAEAKRLTSTDSGIEVDTGYFASPEDNDDVVIKDDEAKAAEGDVEDAGKDLMFPPYSCNFYEDLMIFTLDVKRVDAASLEKSSMGGEPFGFGLRFSSVGAGLAPFHYGFHCALVVPEAAAAAFASIAAPSDRVEVEVWDNNVIVKVSLPAGLDCGQYKVGSSAADLTIHNLPQLRALRKKRDTKLKNNNLVKSPSDEKKTGDDASSGPSASLPEDASQPAPKERHGSGDSEDSVLADGEVVDAADVTACGAVADTPSFSVSEPPSRDAAPAHAAAKKPYDPVVILPDGTALRSILKERKQRCFSESQLELLSWKGASGVSGANSEASSDSLSSAAVTEADEERDPEGASICGSKKSVRFDEVVQRKVFRPTSSIAGLTAKNKKKRDQKRKRAERRASECDDDEEGEDGADGQVASSAEGDDDVKRALEDEHTDSGVASSMDEGSVEAARGDAAAAAANAGGAKGKKGGKKNRGSKRRLKQQQQKLLAAAASDLIFDLDM